MLGQFRWMRRESDSQLPLDFKKRLPPETAPKPTGNIWKPSSKYPASVPVPLPVVMVRVDGPFTALDRKLWLLLLHHAWDDLENERFLHTISIAEILRLFRQFGRHDIGQVGKLKDDADKSEAAALWDSLGRLVATKVRWEDTEYKGIASLVNAVLMTKEHRLTGWVHYAFGELFAKQLLLPRIFARLRPHFMMRLRSKYAITLYEILEGYVNRRDSSFTVSIDDLQRWLKVPKGAYPDWRELKKRVIEPAVREINENDEDAGFVVSYEGVRQGRAFTEIRFNLTQTASRADRDAALQGRAQRKRSFAAKRLPAGADYQPTDEVWDQTRKLARGWDLHKLVAQFNSWSKGKPAAENPHGAFLGWVKRFVANTPLATAGGEGRRAAD